MYTTMLGEGPDMCRVNGYNDEVPVPCRHDYLPSPGHIGGHDVDVDAFTFGDEDYGLLIGRNMVLQTKGVWTRVRDMEGAYCYAPTKEINHPWCTVVVDITLS